MCPGQPVLIKRGKFKNCKDYSSSIITTSTSSMMARKKSKPSIDPWQPKEDAGEENVTFWSQLKLFNSETTLHGPIHVTADKRHPIERYFLQHNIMVCNKSTEEAPRAQEPK
jgi:hypothetical protein